MFLTVAPGDYLFIDLNFKASYFDSDSNKRSRLDDVVQTGGEQNIF